MPDAEATDDTSMTRARAWLEKNKMTLHELGIRMGFEESAARQSAFQFLKTKDPRISTLRRFCRASGLTIEELTGAPKPTKKMKAR